MRIVWTLLFGASLPEVNINQTEASRSVGDKTEAVGRQSATTISASTRRKVRGS